MQKLLVTIDFSEITPLLLAQAQEIALKFHSRLWLLHVADPDPDFIGYQTGPQTRRDHVAEHLRDDHSRLQQLATNLRAQGFDSTALLIQGTTADKIVQEAQKLEITLIIMGSHHYNPVQKVLMGSVSENVLKKSPCPVLVVPYP